MLVKLISSTISKAAIAKFLGFPQSRGMSFLCLPKRERLLLALSPGNYNPCLSRTAILFSYTLSHWQNVLSSTQQTSQSGSYRTGWPLPFRQTAFHRGENNATRAG